MMTSTNFMEYLLPQTSTRYKVTLSPRFRQMRRNHILFCLRWDLMRDLMVPLPFYWLLGHTLWCIKSIRYVDYISEPDSFRETRRDSQIWQLVMIILLVSSSEARNSNKLHRLTIWTVRLTMSHSNSVGCGKE